MPSLNNSEAPGGAAHVGIRALMQAILDDGIRSYFGRPGRIRAEAESWIESDRCSVFSFVTVCETLGLASGAVRAELQIQRAARGAHRPPRYRQNTRRDGVALKGGTAPPVRVG